MSATAVRQARPVVRESPRPVGMKLFFTWAGLCLLGIPLAGYLGWGVAGHVDGVAPALLGGALTGAGIAATSAGLAVGLALGAFVVGFETTTSQLAIMGAVQGAFVGVAQGMVLRNRFSLWHVWMVAMPVFFSIGWVVTDFVIDSGQRFTVFGASGVVVFAILSGLLLVTGMRGAKSSSA